MPLTPVVTYLHVNLIKHEVNQKQMPFVQLQRKPM
jgi:hypothetical protein